MRTMSLSVKLPLFVAMACLIPWSDADAQCHWHARTGLLPDQTIEPWTPSPNMPPGALTLGADYLTIRTIAVRQNAFFIQSQPQLTLPRVLIIEASVQYVSGVSIHSSRAPIAIAFDTGSGRGNMLYIGDDEVFLNQADGGFLCSRRGNRKLRWPSSGSRN